MKARFVMVDFEGDDAGAVGVMNALRDAMHPAPAPAPAPVPALAPLPEQAQLPPLAAAIREATARAPDKPRRRSSPKPARAETAPAKSGRLVLVCREKPGRTFTAEEAAELAGVRAIHSNLSYAKKTGREWAAAGNFHFKCAVPGDPGEARPRHSGQSLPMNPRVNGGAARITHAEVPTPAEIAADE